MKTSRGEKIKRILVLSRNNIGDCLLTTPMLRSLKRRYPRAHLAVSIPEANRDLLVCNPHVDEIVVRPRKTSWAAKIGFAGEIRRRNYDVIISLQEKSMFYAWATFYAGLGRNRLLTVSLEHRRTRPWYRNLVPMVGEQHEVYKYLSIAESLDCSRERSPVLELEPPEESQQRVEEYLAFREVDPDTRFIGINPGGSTDDKRWPEERFAAVADRLHRELGLPIMIFGGPSDQNRASHIADLMKSPSLVIAGRASLGDTAAYLERCQLLVTGDTGPMHMAVALAVPVVAMFGPTNPNKWGPFTKLRSVVRHEEPCPVCSTPCLHTIHSDECAEAALKLFSAPPFRRVRMDQR